MADAENHRAPRPPKANNHAEVMLPSQYTSPTGKNRPAILFFTRISSLKIFGFHHLQQTRNASRFKLCRTPDC
jgi:hypothetical protein